MAYWGLLLMPLAIPLGRASVIVGCPIFRYMHNGSCHACPVNCTLCVSGTNCTLCQKGFYGPVCENRCGEGCTGTCHKVYGHCTYGCSDGEYPAENNRCRQCPLRCALCKSQTECALCEDGHFGIGCQKTCPEHCTTCNITSGQCLQCKNSYYMCSGLCKSCPEGCRVCASVNMCTQCKDAYVLIDGLCRSCPHGCRFCKSMDSCQSCEDGFHGPVNGRCLYKCPINSIINYNVPNKDGRCGFWQGTDVNICHVQSESHYCTTRGDCLLEEACPASFGCFVDKEEQIPCATIMQYECRHACKRLFSSYGCEAICSVQDRGNGHNNLSCMANADPTDVDIFQKSLAAYCNQDQVAPIVTSDTSLTTVTVLIVCAILFALIIVILISQRISIRRLTKQNMSIEEGSKNNTLTGPVSGAQGTSDDDGQTTKLVEHGAIYSTDNG